MSLAGELVVDLDAIVANWRSLDALSAPEVETAAVLKADAYGCGIPRVAIALARRSVGTFFVALPSEGAVLRQALGHGPLIYVLAGYPPQQTAPDLGDELLRDVRPEPAPTGPGPVGPEPAEDAPASADPASSERRPLQPRPISRLMGGGTGDDPPPLILRDPAPPPSHSSAGEVDEALLYRADDLRPVLNSAAQAAAWFRECPGAPCAIHLDTGMSRLGMDADEFASLGALPDAVRLVMSHLACADEPAHPMNAHQLVEFTRQSKPVQHIPRSLCNTGGIMLGPGVHFDVTRAGVGLYGGLPFEAARPVVTLHLPILQVRDLPPGATVGYGATWQAHRPSRIATVSGGYADGLIRALGNSAVAYLDGQPVPFVGRVSMDLISLDVTECPAARSGAMVEILGPHQTVDQLAAAAGTIGYEILTALGSRYTRRYTGG